MEKTLFFYTAVLLQGVMWPTVFAFYQPRCMRFWLNDVLNLHICMDASDYGRMPWCVDAGSFTSDADLSNAIAATLFLLWVFSLPMCLAYYYKRDVLRELFLKPVGLEQAEIVLIERKSGKKFSTVEFCEVITPSKTPGTPTTNGPGEKKGTPVIDFQYTRYLINTENPSPSFSAPDNPMHRASAALMHALLVQEPSTPRQAQDRSSARAAMLARCGPNFVNFRVPSLWVFLSTEFYTPLFMVQFHGFVLLAFYYYWQNTSLMLLLAFFAGVQAAVISRRSLLEVKDLANASADRSVEVLCSPGGGPAGSPRSCSAPQFRTLPAKELIPGDVIRLSGLEIMPADTVLVKGQAVTQESALTGEPMPVNKFPVVSDKDFVPSAGTHGKKHFLFAGTDVVQTSKNAVAVVVRTGVATKRGDLLRRLLVEESSSEETVADWYWERNLVRAYQLLGCATFVLVILNIVTPSLLFGSEQLGGGFLDLLPQNFIENICLILYILSPLIRVGIRNAQRYLYESFSDIVSSLFFSSTGSGPHPEIGSGGRRPPLC